MSDFHITPEHATDLAQMVHNSIDTNGIINEQGIIEVMLDQYADYLRANINWDKISDDDEDAEQEIRDFMREKTEASKGEY